MIGRTIGRYHVVSELGHGGMGSVWKAEDKLLGRSVALKIMAPGLADSDEARRRFLRGARAAAALDHPGIVAIYDAGQVEGLLYIAGALVDGMTVSQLVANGPVAPEEAIRIVGEVAEALHYAHSHGVIHRDISGGNIMVARDGRVEVLDFGLARATQEVSAKLTQSGVVLGTVSYMAPEVALGNVADERSDLYGLGALLYELLTGAPPFAAERVEALLYKVVHERAAPPSRRRPGINRRLDRLVLRLLAKDPDRRHPSADALHVELLGLDPRGRSHRETRPGEPDRAEPEPPRLAHPEPIPSGAEAGSGSRLLAVLPFRDRRPAGAVHGRGSALAHGLAETVSARLAGLSGLQVIPPVATGVTDGARDPVRVARSLGAGLVLTAGVQRVGPRLRVAWSLLRGTDGVQIAGATLDGELRGLLALEDRLVRGLVRALELEVSATRVTVHHPSRDPAAREHYLQALGYLQRYESLASVDGAIALLERLLESEGDSTQLLAVLGRAYLARYRLCLERTWQQRAARACERALALDPGSADVLVTLGELHIAVGRYAQAVRELRRARRLRKSDPDTVMALGTAYQAAGRMEEAEGTFREAIALRPMYWAGYNRLGTTYFRIGRFDEAERMFRRVTEVAPDSARGHANLGSALYKLGRGEDAIASYQRSLELQPNATAYSSLGTVYFFMGHYREAAVVFEKGAALRPFDPWPWGNLADAYRWIPGEEDRAAMAYEQGIRLAREQLEVNPNDAKRWAELAEWHAKRGRATESVRAIRRSLRIHPGDLSIMVTAIVVHELAGDRAQALEWVREVARRGLNPVELEQDPELASLRMDPGFAAAIGGSSPHSVAG